MAEKNIYRIVFRNQDKVYEIFAQSVNQGHLLGFVEVEKIVFGEKSSVVVDPGEEHLKTEFKEVVRTYIPMHSVIRIDEVSKQGVSRISDAPSGDANVHHLPVYTPPKPADN